MKRRSADGHSAIRQQHSDFIAHQVRLAQTVLKSEPLYLVASYPSVSTSSECTRASASRSHQATPNRVMLIDRAAWRTPQFKTASRYVVQKS